MNIQTGKGTIPLLTLLAIWSISLVVNLPGLAVSPVLGDLDKIFPHTSELEIQLLTVLPNLLIIPFVLLSGRLSLSKNKVTIVVFALVVYLISGILYLFAKSMTALIVISCLLGMGCGLLIPLAAGLLADTFVGKYRMQQLGIKSGISNVSLVLATFVVGWLGGGNWHLPFLVYLIPAIPLALSPFLRSLDRSVVHPGAVEASGTHRPASAGVSASGVHRAASGTADAVQSAHRPVAPVKKTVAAPSAARTTASDVPPGKTMDGFYLGRLYGIMGLYFFVCFATVIVSYYLPFLMQDYRMDTSWLGTVTAIFFLAVFLPGFILPWIIKAFKQATSYVAIIAICLGLLYMGTTHSTWGMCIAAFLMGAGYGIFQPVIYDKATETVQSEKKATLALSFVLAVNYLSITVTPFIIDSIRTLFHTHSNQFPFLLNFVLALIFGIVAVFYRHSFVFRMNEAYYKT